jgi:tetratricopeptide (TPR) repeat protein
MIDPSSSPLLDIFWQPSSSKTPRADKYTEHLVDCVDDLTKHCYERLPEISFDSIHNTDPSAVGRGIVSRYHIRQCGKPTIQLRETEIKTLQLLNQLEDIADISAEKLAEKMSDLSLNLHDLGMREEALGMQTFCVILYRGLGPRGTSRNLPLSLDNLALRHADIGDRDEALKINEEALELFRDLAVGDPATFNPDLAMCLTHLSTHLSDMGHYDDGLGRIHEAVTLFEDLHAGQRYIRTRSCTGIVRVLDFAVSLRSQARGFGYYPEVNGLN